jgi:hypothetical protein
MDDGPNYYSAYGLRIQSEVALPELAAADPGDGPPDVTLGLGNVDQFLASLDADTEVNSLEVDSLGRFVVADGRQVIVELCSPEVSQTKYFRRTVENQVLALLLLQRGLLVLHASAVAVGGRAVVFIGPRGAGKSTTAAAFHTQGYPVLADDIVGVRVDEEPPTVVPGVPQLRLGAEAVTALDIDGAVQPNHDIGPEKWYRQLSPVSEPLPLAGCYVLEESDSMAIESLSGTEQFFRFVTHSYRHGFLTDSDMTPTGFEQCAAVVERVPVRLLRRPKQYDALPSLVELVVRDVAATERKTTTG